MSSLMRNEREQENVEVGVSPHMRAWLTPRSNVTRMCKISEKRGKNKGKLYTKEVRTEQKHKK